MKNIFHIKKLHKDRLDSKCIPCMKKNYLDNRNKLKQYYLNNRDGKENFQLKNHDKINTRQKIYFNNRYKTDINFRLICKTRSRTYHVLNDKLKSSFQKIF